MFRTRNVEYRMTKIEGKPSRCHEFRSSPFILRHSPDFLVVGAFVALFGGSTAFGQVGPPPGEPPKSADDLGQRLIRKAVTENEEDIMATIVRLMTEASRKMEIEFNPGKETQALQAHIQEKLDEAIKAAASKQRARRQTAAATDPDKRRMPTAGKREPRPEKKVQGEGSTKSTSTTGDTPTGDLRKDSEHAALRETRRSWGHLPRREREEVIQGVGEGFLEKYRAWIERYYRALQESNE